VRYPDLDRTGLPEFFRLDDYRALEW
jgi:hypothetical protein